MRIQHLITNAFIHIQKNLSKQPLTKANQIRDFEICLFDTQPAAIGGLNEEVSVAKF